MPVFLRGKFYSQTPFGGYCVPGQRLAAFIYAFNRVLHISPNSSLKSENTKQVPSRSGNSKDCQYISTSEYLGNFPPENWLPPGKSICNQVEWKNSKCLNGFLKREPFLYILLLHIIARLLFRMNSCILRMHWLGICILHPTACTPCTIALHPGQLSATPRRNWLSDSAIVQLTYSYTLWETSSEKRQVSAKVHTIHMYVITHNAVSCIAIEKFSLLLIFLMLTTTWVTLKMLTIWIIQRNTTPL